MEEMLLKSKLVFLAAAVSAAFTLGFLVRGEFHKPSGDLEYRQQEVATEPAEMIQQSDSRAIRAEEADPKVETSTTSDSTQKVLTSTSRTPREIYAANKRKRLADFFVINGIGAQRANQIIEDLIDADHYIVQKQNVMIENRIAENAEQIAQGVEVNLGLSKEEAEGLASEEDMLYRGVFGEYYDAYKTYESSFNQRLVVRTFSSELAEPLEYAAGEALVEIMYEENAPLKSRLLTAIAEFGESDKAQMFDVQLEAKRSYNRRVLSRSRAYLSPTQFERLKDLLEEDIRRIELYQELAEIESTN